MTLEIKRLSKKFGGLKAVSEIDLRVEKGEILGIIGPNGAGKTTLFNLITGVLKPSSGQVNYNGLDITNKRPHQIAKIGIGRTFQLNPLFNNFTVKENILASFHLHPKSSLLDIFFNTSKYRRNEKEIARKTEEIISLLALQEYEEQTAGNLPHGYQKLLGLARALAVQPSLLLLDEPLGGMNPAEIDLTIEAIQKIKAEGVTLLIVEHNMQILDCCQRVVVINFGKKICDGLPDEIRENPEVIEAYFGGAVDA